MNRSVTVFLIVIMSLTFIVGCDSQREVSTDVPAVTEETTIAVNIEKNVPENSDLLESFYLLLTPDSEAIDLVNFFKENVAESNEEEAKIMVDWITVYQTEVFERFNKTNLLFEAEYSKAYFDEMEGNFCPDKFDEIENDEIRLEFENLTNSFLTIVMYKFNSYVVTDWEAILSFKEYFSEEFNLSIQNKINSTDFYLERDFNQFPDSSEFKWMSESIINDNKHLDILKLSSSNDAFITNKVNELIASSIVELSKGKESYAVSMFSIYNNMKYTSVFISLRYLNEAGNTNYNERAISFDLESGKEVTLDSFLGLSESDSIEYANNIAGTDFSMMPYMEFYEAGIILKARKDDDSVIRFGYISLKDLIEFTTEEILLSWYNY